MNETSRPASGAGPPHRDAVARKRLEDWLDDALDDTFPASDPVATAPNSPKIVERPERSGPARRQKPR